MTMKNALTTSQLAVCVVSLKGVKLSIPILMMWMMYNLHKTDF